MSNLVYRYDFAPQVETTDVEATLVLALVGTEALRGETATQLETSHYFDLEKRVCLVDASTEAGRDFNSLFAGFLRREFGADAFSVRRVATTEFCQSAAA